MKQKRKLGRKLLSFLLTLAMLVGLMPGMGLKAFAADAVAKVGETEYATLSEALTAWTDGSTLTLLADVETASTITVSATKILDLNGHNITMTDSGNIISIGSGAALTLKGEGSVGVIENYGTLDFYDATALLIWTKGGTTNIYSGSVTATDGTWTAVNVSEGATVNIFGGTIYASGWRCVHANNSTVNISGGIFQSSVEPLSVENGGKIILSGGYFQRSNVGKYTLKDGYTMIDSNDSEKGAKMVCAVIDGVTLDPTTATLTVGGTQELTATVSPEIATFKTVTWTSSNEVVATVDENGVVTAVAAGTANITATATNGTGDTADDKTATCAVTVNKLDSAVKKAPEAKTLTYTGSAQELVTTGTAEGGTMQYALGKDATTAPTEGWGTSIPTATNAGTYYVWYKAVGDNDHADSEAAMTEVTISEKAVTPEVKFDATAMELKAGESGSIKATVVPEDAKVQWKSDKETVATVDNTGKVTAVGAGTAKITATITVAGTQYKAECTVTVQEEPVTPEVKFDVTTMELENGQTGTIAVTVEPSDAVVTWSSDKETVATVDNTGKVTAVGAGTAKITATITVAGTQYKAECTVTVAEEEPSETKPVISIDDLPDAIDGESYNYTLTAGGVQPITWSITAGSLPAGLSLESESGKISGTPTSTGTSTFTVTATNTYDSTSKEMSITVQAGSTVVDTEGSAPDDQKTAVESAPSVVRDIVGDAAGGVTESDTVRLILTTDSRDEGSVTGEEKEAVDAIKGAAEGSGLVVGTFVDLTLSYEVKNANGEITSSGQISQTARPLTVKFPIPAGLQKAGRLFKIFRYHGSNASEIGSGSGDAVDVSTDLFSIYAIAYTDDAAPDVPEGEESSEQPHVHTFAWDTRNATADTDGEMRYQCTKCGMIQTRVPISAYYIFNKETTEKIRAAKQGETVKIETRRWISFHKMVAEALAERKDVSVEVSFLDQGHKGNPYTFTIPAGTDLTPLFDESGFAGFMYLGNRFGLTEN